MGNRDETVDKPQQARPADASLAIQNKGGILLALAGTAVGLVLSSPWLALAGLATGFVTGNLGFDGDKGIVRDFIGSRHQAASVTAKEGDVPTVSDPARLAELQSASPSTALPFSSVAFDQDFSQSNGALATSSRLPTRSSRLHR